MAISYFSMEITINADQASMLHSVDMDNRFFEEIKIQSHDLVEKVKELIHEGNVRRVIIKDDKGNTFMEVPLAIAAIGAIAAPVLAAIGAVATMVANFTVVIEREKTPPTA